MSKSAEDYRDKAEKAQAQAEIYAARATNHHSAYENSVAARTMNATIAQAHAAIARNYLTLALDEEDVW